MEVVRDQTPMEVVDNQTLYHGYPHYDKSKIFIDQQHYHPIAGSTTPAESIKPISRRKWTWIVPALIGGLIGGVLIGGAVGGGLGASLAKCNDNSRSMQQANLALSLTSDPESSPSATTTTTVTVTVSVSVSSSSSAIPTTTGGLMVDYEVTPPSSIYNVTMDCDKLAKTTQRSGRQDKFSVFCRVDLLTGPRIDSEGNEFLLSDMVGLRAYRFQDCIDACSSTNALVNNKGTGKGCKSVTFFNYLSDSYENCWLKNGSVTAAQGRASEDYVVSAVLLE